MRYASVFFALVLLLGLSAAPADAAEPGWRIRGFGAYSSPDTSETTINGDGDEILIEADGGFGGGASVEYQFHRFVGVEGGFLLASPELSLSADVPALGAISVSDTMTTTVFTADLLVHLTPGSSTFDLYAGAGVAGVNPGSLSFNLLDIQRLNVKAESYVTWSARAGLDLSLGEGSGWGITVGVRYVPGEPEFRQLGLGPDEDDSADLGFNIFTVTAGVAYRF